VQTYVALYGNVAIPKAYCDRCRRAAWVLHGRLACCGWPILIAPDRFKRESEPVQKRKLPPRADRELQLARQGHRCFYCDRSFGTYVFRGASVRPIRLRPEWDHMVPFAYSQNNQMVNFVAACHVCNRLKSDHCFQTIDDAKLYLLRAWETKGYG